MCVINLQKNSLLCFTQKTLTVFFCLSVRHILKEGCSWQVQGETERYRPKCTCTNTSNTCSAWGDQISFCNHPSTFLSPHHCKGYIHQYTSNCISFFCSRNLSFSCCFDLLFLYIYKHLYLYWVNAESKMNYWKWCNTAECLTCCFSKLLVFVVVNFY